MGWVCGTCGGRGKVLVGIRCWGRGESEGKRPLEGPRRKYSKHTSKKWVLRAWTELIWFRIGICSGLYQINTDICTHIL